MNVRIIIINDDQEWQLTPAAKLVYIVRSPDVKREPYEAVLLRRASQLKNAHFLPDETINLDEGPPHPCQVIDGELEMEGPVVIPVANQVFEHPVTYWIDRPLGFLQKLLTATPLCKS